MHAKRLFVSIALACSLLGGCAKQLSGSYIDSSGNLSLSFGSGDKVTYHANETGRTVQGSYVLHGDKLTVREAGGTLGIFTLQPNGCLHSPTMGELCRPKPAS
jgi:hypothetical protein